MKKRILSILLACIMVLCYLPTTTFAATANSYDMAPQTLPLTLDATGEQVNGSALTYDESLTEYGLSYKLKVDMSPINTLYEKLKQFVDTPTVKFSDLVTFKGDFKLSLTVAEKMTISEDYNTDDKLTEMAKFAFAAANATTNFDALFTVGNASWSGKTATFTISFNNNITGASITAAGGIPDFIFFTAPAGMLSYPQTDYSAIGMLTAKAALTESSFVIGIPSQYQNLLMFAVNAARQSTDQNISDVAKALFPTDAAEPISALNVSVNGSATNELTMDKLLSKEASPTILPPDTLKTTVTLTLPSFEKKKDADVVFVVDASDDKKIGNIISEAQEMVGELLNKNNVNTKVGIVQFSEHVGDVRSLTALTTESAVDINDDLTGVADMVAAEMAATPYMSRGSNIQGALRNAKAILALDNTVAAANKYIVLLTDGGPTFYENENRDVMTMYVNPGGRVAQYDTRIGYQERYSIADVANYDAASVQALLTESILANGTNLSGTELDNILKNVGPEFGDDVSGKSGSDVPGAQPNWGGANPAPIFVTMLEKGFYHLCTEMLDIKNTFKYNIITVSWPYHAEKTGGEVHTKMSEGLMLWIEQYIGARYVNDAADAVKELSTIENAPFIQLASGTVTDIIEDKFNLVIKDGVCPFTLTVNGAEQTASSDGDNKWNFGIMNENNVYPYSVNYTPGDGEKFEWIINVPTENDNSVKLSYDLILVDTSKSGEFPTNKSAVLTYKNSDGMTEPNKLFNVPKVKYTGVTFDFNGGTNLNHDNPTQNVALVENTMTPGEYFVSPDDIKAVNATNKDGCKPMLGWSETKPTEDMAWDGDLSNYLNKYPLAELPKAKPDAIYYALWQKLPSVLPETIKITYHTNGGVAPINPGEGSSAESYSKSYTMENATQGVSVVIDGNDVAKFSREGYQFNGWNTKPDGTGTAWQATPANAPLNQHPILKENLDLYAQWTKISITGIKNLFGTTLNADMFEFRLIEMDIPQDGTVLNGIETKNATELRVKNNIQGVFTFTLPTSISNQKIGSTAVYKITEVNNGIINYIYDTTVYYVQVNVNAQGVPDYNTVKIFTPTNTTPNDIQKVDAILFNNIYFPSTNPGLYTLIFNTNGGTSVPSITKNAGSVIILNQTTIKSGYIFEGWYSDAALTNKVTSVVLNKNMIVYAKWTPTTAPETFRNDHISYIIGYKDGLVHPEANITRGETATIFFRLLTDAARNKYWMTSNNFSDVDSLSWFNNAISTMSNAGFINGYTDGTFGGDKPITRAEFAVIAARANGASGEFSGSYKFSDISDSWAKGYINEAVDMGLITGYPDGNFKPNSYITRAEAMTIVNRFLGRDKLDATSLILDMIKWPDNMNTNVWYYYAVQEATNSHEYTRQSNGIESWIKTTVSPDWAALEKSWSTANSAK